MAKKKAVKYPQFMSLADFAKLVNRTEEEIMVYVKSGVISTECCCYPAKFGDGKAIAFLPAKMLDFIEKASTVADAPPEKKPEPKPKEKPKSKK